MATPSHRTSTASIAKVNLYCAQCDSQLGIFDNEWSRLTSSYARSKEKGTHFATEVGTKIQVVPSGASQKAADGCSMSEVFCRKCSCMVGQYCKSAPDVERQPLVDQYFYKLSRVYLKDAHSSTRVEPIFGYGPDQLQTSSARPSMGPRGRLSSVSLGTFTPSRQLSATPLPSASAGPSRLQNVDFPLTSANSTTAPSQDVDESDFAQALAATQSKISAQELRTKNNASRIKDHDLRLRELDERADGQDARISDTESCIAAQAQRIEEQEALLKSQDQRMQQQERQLQNVLVKLENLQSIIASLRSHASGSAEANSGQDAMSLGNTDFISNLESLIKATKAAQSNTIELQVLREENEMLKDRLQSAQSVIDPAVLAGASGFAAAEVSRAVSLGKRKRDDNNGRQSSLTIEVDGRIPCSLQLVQALEGMPQQTLTPQSSQGSEHSPLQAPSIRNTDADSFSASNDIRSSSASVNSTNQPLSNDTPTQHPLQSQDQSIPLGRDKDAQSDQIRQVSTKCTLLTPEEGQSNPSGSVSELNQPPNLVNEASIAEGCDFSDEEFHTNMDLDEPTPVPAKPPLLSQATTKDPMRHITDVSVANRDDRSMAPEPTKRCSTTGGRSRNFRVDMDMNAIATPQMFTEQIRQGIDPKPIRPPSIQTREKDLNEELIKLGLPEWIGKDKTSKAYRDAVDAARIKQRNLNKATRLYNLGLEKAITPQDLQRIQAEKLALANQPPVVLPDVTPDYQDSFLMGILQPPVIPVERAATKARSQAQKSKATRKSTSFARPVQESADQHFVAKETVDTSQQPQTTRLEAESATPNGSSITTETVQPKQRRARKPSTRASEADTTSPNAVLGSSRPANETPNETVMSSHAAESINSSILEQANVTEETNQPIDENAAGKAKRKANVSGSKTKKKPRRSGRGSNAEEVTILRANDPTAVDNEDDCAVCGKDGELLCCDGCPKSYHHQCADPTMDPKVEVAGDWFCPSCLEKKKSAPSQPVPMDTTAQDMQRLIMERDRMAREVMEREDAIDSGRY